jgi:quercetin dioxygenase-like cupin family protein
MSQADSCPCPNWGYALKGRLRVDTNGQEEILQAGDAYALAPGHVAIANEDTKFLEVALSDLHQPAIAAVLRNMGFS